MTGTAEITHARAALERQHRALEQEIAEEERRPSPNNLIIAELKKRKLLVKEQIEGLGR